MWNPFEFYEILWNPADFSSNMVDFRWISNNGDFIWNYYRFHCRFHYRFHCNFHANSTIFQYWFHGQFYYIYQDFTEINKISWNPQHFTGFHWNQQDFIRDFTENSIPVKSVMKLIIKSANEIHSEIHDNPKAHNEKHMLFMKSGALDFSCVFHVLLTFHVLFTFQMLSLFRYAFHVLFTFQLLLTFHMCFSVFMCFPVFSAFHVLFTKKHQFIYKKHHFSWKPTKPGQYVCIHVPFKHTCTT